MDLQEPTLNLFLKDFSTKSNIGDSDSFVGRDNSNSDKIVTIAASEIWTYIESQLKYPWKAGWNVTDAIAVPSGDSDNLQPVPIWVPAYYSLTMFGYNGSIRSGTSATLKIKQRAVSAGSYTDVSTGIVIDSSVSDNAGTLSSNNVLSGSTTGLWFEVGIEITAVSSTPRDLGFTIAGKFTRN